MEIKRFYIYEKILYPKKNSNIKKKSFIKKNNNKIFWVFFKKMILILFIFNYFFKSSFASEFVNNELLIKGKYNIQSLF